MVKCKICGRDCKLLNYRHLQKHNITVKEYKELYPHAKLCDEGFGFKKGNKPWNLGTKGIMKAWNVGLTKETDERVLKYSLSNIGKPGGRKGYKCSEELKKKISIANSGERNAAKRPEVRAKISKTLLQTYKDHPEILENRKVSGHNQFSGHYTSIEKVVKQSLDKLNIPFSHNLRLGRYFADFVIFNNVVIECDGEYWHRNSKEKDDIKDSYLHNKGFMTFRLPEKRIMEEKIECVKAVIQIVEMLNE